jgi:diaminohydroxyphosphoribosylaminopyrimidine deaminase/5-amino-6-(5-phosphoribosylamino)uracil reductase
MSNKSRAFYIYGVLADEKYMQRCLQLALLGQGNVAPNPMVGCVIVCGNEIIGEGYHKKLGSSHAEVEAMRSVADSTKLQSSVLYVNLEPCSHFGKTPPCADLIVRCGIPEVVVGMTDPNVLVAGKGISRLREAGITVRQSDMEKECRFLNRRFVINHERNRPYIILKWAQSLDGYMDIDRTTGVKGVHWITGSQTKRIVHQWRSAESAVLVGAGTVRNDDPMLTVREIEGRQPLRIILDPGCRISPESHVLTDGFNTMVINEMKSEIVSGHLEYVQLSDMHENLSAIMDLIYQRNIASLIVEGGRHTIMQFLEAGLYDEVRILKGSKELHGGLQAPKIELGIIERFDSGHDQIIQFYNNFS